MLILGSNVKDVTRSGVIPYTWCAGHLWFLLGIDKKTRDLSDFGGGRKKKETPIEAAYREFNEETCNMFATVISKDDLARSIALQGTGNAIFFVHVSEKWLNVADNYFRVFQRYLLSPHDVEPTSTNSQTVPKTLHKHIELIGVKWVREDHFWNVAFSDKNLCMWKNLQTLFKKHTNSLELKVFLTVDHSLRTQRSNNSNK